MLKMEVLDILPNSNITYDVKYIPSTYVYILKILASGKTTPFVTLNFIYDS